MFEFSNVFVCKHSKIRTNNTWISVQVTKNVQCWTSSIFNNQRIFIVWTTSVKTFSLSRPHGPRTWRVGDTHRENDHRTFYHFLPFKLYCPRPVDHHLNDYGSPPRTTAMFDDCFTTTTKIVLWIWGGVVGEASWIRGIVLLLLWRLLLRHDRWGGHRMSVKDRQLRWLPGGPHEAWRGVLLRSRTYPCKCRYAVHNNWIVC